MLQCRIVRSARHKLLASSSSPRLLPHSGLFLLSRQYKLHQRHREHWNLLQACVHNLDVSLVHNPTDRFRDWLLPNSSVNWWNATTGPMSEKARSLLIFDFDHSLIDCNSDPWVVDHLGASQLMLSLRPRISSWTDLMDRMMVELAACGRTVGDIEDALRQIPVHPAMIRAIKAAYSWGWDLQIISDANVFFIHTILASHHLDHYFTEVHSNRAQVDEQGVLRIEPYQRSPPHVCPLCPPNMCKGLILDNIRAAAQLQNRRTIYIGDGGGDYCPSVRLQEVDHVLAREGYPLLRLLEKDHQAIKAKVHTWSSALDVESCLLDLYHSEQKPC